MAASPTRHRLALAVALAGVVVSAVTLYVDLRLASDAGYTSFCNVNNRVNCDVVLASPYGRFLEIPVPVWSAAAFSLGALLAFPGAFGMAGRLPDVLLAMLAWSSLGFTLAMAGIAAFVLEALCLLCVTMYVVVVAWVIVVRPFAPRLSRVWTTGSFVIGLAAAGWSATRVPPVLETAQAICEADPRFCEFYREQPTSAPATVLGTARHVKGDPGAPITIVEFSDFECPACAQAFLDLHDLVRRRRDVRLVFRHFPLDDRCNADVPHGVHPTACLAACAAECAGQQGKFWEFHDLLFANQAAIARESLFGLARDTGLDIPRFRTCLDDPATLDVVRGDARAGSGLGVKSTPTIFINGRRIEGSLERHYYNYAITLETQPAATPPG
jgi:protein-disulfide isomerase/uncharacterized membrane protein